MKEFDGVPHKALFEHEELNKRFYVYDDNGNSYPRTGESRLLPLSKLSNTGLGAQMKWFQDISNLVYTLFVAHHVGPVGVARASEIESLSVENIEACPRTIFCMYGFLVAALRYNKLSTTPPWTS